MLRATARALHVARRRADCISVTNLQLECIVGIYAHERAGLQPLRIDIELEVDMRAAAQTESCATTIDYVAVAEQVRRPPVACCAAPAASPDPRLVRQASPNPNPNQARFVMESGRFQLLETAAQSIARLLLTAPAPDEERGVAQRVHVTLIKPEALAGSAVPSVSVWRDAEDEVFGWAARPFGAIEAVHEWPPSEGGGGGGSGGGSGGGGEHASVHRVRCGGGRDPLLPTPHPYSLPLHPTPPPCHHPPDPPPDPSFLPSLAPGGMLDTAADLGPEVHILPLAAGLETLLSPGASTVQVLPPTHPPTHTHTTKA